MQIFNISSMSAGVRIKLRVVPFIMVFCFSSSAVPYRPDETLPPFHAFGRHKVLDVQHVSYDEVMLTVEGAADGMTRQVRLTGFW